MSSMCQLCECKNEYPVVLVVMELSRLELRHRWTLEHKHRWHLHILVKDRATHRTITSTPSTMSSTRENTKSGLLIASDFMDGFLLCRSQFSFDLQNLADVETYAPNPKNSPRPPLYEHVENLGNERLQKHTGNCCWQIFFLE